MIEWDCILCGNENEPAVTDREAMFCSFCRSTWRVRATALGVLVGVGTVLAPYPEVPADWSWRGLGVSDHISLASALGTRFDYTNTWYHRYPRLNLLEVPNDLIGEVSFVSCSDVLEHVPPPADRALAGLRRMLRPGGFAVLSVPCASDGTTHEFYPGLVEWQVLDNHVHWLDDQGRRAVDEQPEFHGGPGQTLAFRQWSAPDFIAQVRGVGFSAVVSLPDANQLGVPQLDGSGMFLAYA